MLKLPTSTGPNVSSPRDGSGLKVAVIAGIALKGKGSAEISRRNNVPEVTAGATSFLPSWLCQGGPSSSISSSSTHSRSHHNKSSGQIPWTEPVSNSCNPVGYTVTLVTTAQQIMTEFWPAETEKESFITTIYVSPAFTLSAVRLALLDKSGPSSLQTGGFKGERTQAPRCTSLNSPASAQHQDDTSRLRVPASMHPVPLRST
jgi:hypothetical protein